MVLDFGGGIFREGIGATAGGPTQIKSFNPSAFVPEEDSNTYTVKYKVFGYSLRSDGDANGFFASVELPDKSTITRVVVFGTTGVWTLGRYDFSGSATFFPIANGNLGVSDFTLEQDNAEVDNEKYTYLLKVDLDNTQRLYGGKIYYTLND